MINKYRISWIECHRVSTIVEANSPEEALEIAKDEDSDCFTDVEEIESYGPIVADSYEIGLVDNEE